MKKTFIFVLTGVFMLTLAGVAWAGHGECDKSGNGHHKGEWGGPMKAFKGLDLTQQQQDQVDAILDRHREEKKQLQTSLKDAEKTLHEAVHADAFNEQAIRDASKTLSANMEEMAVLRGKIFSEIRTLLTPEQVQKLSEMRMRRHD